MKRLFLFSSLMVLFSAMALAQTDTLFIKKAPRVKFGLTTQSQYAMFGKTGNAWGNYVIPSMSYDNSKWHFEGAVALGNTQYNGSMFAGVNQPSMQSSPINNMSFFGRGAYQFNSKLTINTVVYRNANTMYMPMANARAFDFSSSGVGVGLSYKFSDNVRFDFGMQFRQGYEPYYQRFGNSYYNNNFLGNSVFGNNAYSGFDGL